LRSNI
jgi:hypothetical protein